MGQQQSIDSCIAKYLQSKDKEQFLKQIEQIFAKYDTDHSEMLEGKEIDIMLQDLMQQLFQDDEQVGKEQKKLIAQYIETKMDMNQDKKISLQVQNVAIAAVIHT